MVKVTGADDGAEVIGLILRMLLLLVESAVNRLVPSEVMPWGV